MGSIFRTADAAGVSHVYLSGYTPTPIDRFGRPQKEIAKTALGAEQSIPWSAAKEPAAFMGALKKDGFTLVGLEQDARSIPYDAYSKAGDVALLLGNEVHGLSPALRKKCDVLLEIPMRGKKESLNVSVAAGIALFALNQ